MENKKETLEEAAEKYASYTHINGEKVEIGRYFDEIKKSHFMAGAKWQQEQEKKMYSEQDMKIAFEIGRSFQLTRENNFNEFIEQLNK